MVMQRVYVCVSLWVCVVAWLCLCACMCLLVCQHLCKRPSYCACVCVCVCMLCLCVCTLDDGWHSSPVGGTAIHSVCLNKTQKILPSQGQSPRHTDNTKRSSNMTKCWACVCVRSVQSITAGPSLRHVYRHGRERLTLSPQKPVEGQTGLPQGRDKRRHFVTQNIHRM